MTNLLTLHDITVAYGALRAVDALNLHLQAGSRHAIIGPNGAGKSTLINVITGNLRPTTGRVMFDGADVTALSAHRRARAGIGRTWQHSAVHHPLTALDNVLTAVPRQPLASRAHRPTAVAAAHRALADVGLAGHARTRAAHLPYGQRRLLEVAIALAGQPKLLLLDEPSAGLDRPDLDRLTALIRALPADVAVLLIDHNPGLVDAVADSVTVLHHGRVLTAGTPDQIRQDPQTRTAYPASTTAEGGRPTPPSGDTPLLSIRALSARYTDADVLTDINLDLHPGQVTAVLGDNGAGKTTLLNTIAGLHPARPGSHLTLNGTPITRLSPHARVHAGLALVPQGRRLFDTLTVNEHLAVAGRTRPRRTPAPIGRDDVPGLFPALAARRNHRPGQLSGGEQQQLAIARALLTGPRVLLLDEPGEGLAAAITNQLAEIIRRLAGSGAAILLAEQNPHLTPAAADRVAVLHHRTITPQNTSNPSHPDLRVPLDLSHTDTPHRNGHRPVT